MMKTRILLGAIAILTAFSASPSVADTRLIVNCFWPAQHRMCSQVLPTWLDQIEEATDGRVTGIIPPKSLAAPADQWTAVESGIADVAAQFSGFSADRVQGPLVTLNLFTATNSPPAMSQALWETYQAYFPNEYEGVHLLSMWVVPSTPIYSVSGGPVESADDLSSRKVWSPPGNTAELMKMVGAGVVAGPAVQANELISRGVVDAFLGVAPSDVVTFQLLPYVTSTTWFQKGIYGPSFSLFMNEDTWAEISLEDQAAITELSGIELGQLASTVWNDENKIALADMEDADIVRIEASPDFEAAMVEAAKPVTQSWIEAANAKGIDAEAALDFYTRRAAELTEAAQ